MSEIIKYSVDDNQIGYLAMEDVENQNIFRDEFLDKLVKAFDELEKLNPKVVVLTGLPDVFCAGADKKNLMDLCDGTLHVKDLIISEKIINFPVPVIGVMEGHAMGGGLTMGLCCDIALAARESRYGVVFMGMGFTPGMGTTTLIQGMFGQFIGAEMMYTAKRFKGSELEKKSTNINYILPKAELRKKAQQIALQISEKNIKSIQLLKYSLVAPKKKLLIDARLQEDFMHKLSFAYPETRKNVEDFYASR